MAKQSVLVGDRVEVIGMAAEYYGGGLGTVIYEDGLGYVVKTDYPNKADCGDGTLWCFAEDLAILDENKTKAGDVEMENGFKVGDKAIVTNLEFPMGGFEIGDTVTIEKTDSVGRCLFQISADRTGGLLVGFCHPESLKKIEDTGFKVGDLVRGTSESSSAYYVTNANMTKGEVVEIDEDGRLNIKVLEGAPGTFTAQCIDDVYPVLDPKYFERLDGVVEEVAEDEYKVGDIVFGKEEYGYYSPDRQFLLTEKRADGGFYYEPHNFEPYDPARDFIYPFQIGGKVEMETPKFIKMIGSDLGYHDGDVLEVCPDGNHFIDRDGDERLLEWHNYEVFTGEVTAKTVNKSDVIEYLSTVPDRVLLDVILKARGDK